MKTIVCSFFALLIASPALADQIIPDDLIVSGGSACVGMDCINGENFGFDTLVLKENNLRIYFQDTSSTGGFPSVDWRLVANDSANGGADRFSIEDATNGRAPFTVAGGAPTDALYIAMNGWDVGGNESNFFVRDVDGQTLPVRILPGAGNDVVVIVGDQVGFGTATPAGNLHVAGATVLNVFEDTDGGTWHESFGGANNEWSLTETVFGSPAIVVAANGDVTTAGTVNGGSSRKIKRDIVPVKPADVLASVNALDISRWQYKTDENGARHMGPMAEDFYARFGLGVDDEHIAATDVAGVAVASVQGLSRVVEDQAAELSRLERENAALRKRLDRIEKLLSTER